MWVVHGGLYVITHIGQCYFDIRVMTVEIVAYSLSVMGIICVCVCVV